MSTTIQVAIRRLSPHAGLDAASGKIPAWQTTPPRRRPSWARSTGGSRPREELAIPATDEGLLRGDGVFEVIRVYDGVAFALTDHLDRLERSGANLRLPEVFRAELESEIPELLAARGGGGFDGALRIVITRGGRRLLLTEPAPPSRPACASAFVTFAPTRVLDGIKSLSYGGQHALHAAGPGARLRRGAAGHAARPRARGARRRRCSGSTRTARSARRRSTTTSSRRSRATASCACSTWRSGPARPRR